MSDSNKGADAAKGCVGCLVTFVVLVAVVYFWAANRPGPTPEEQAAKALEEQKIEAIVVSEGFVKDHLKHPNDASFPWSAETKEMAAGHWWIKSQVTAKNEFGAELTYDWITVVKLDPQTKKWVLEVLVLDGETLVGE